VNVGSYREIDVTTAYNTCDLDRAALVDGRKGYARGINGLSRGI